MLEKLPGVTLLTMVRETKPGGVNSGWPTSVSR